MSFTLRIVVADDEREMRETLQQMLRDLGHEVVAVAENGESLIEQCSMTQPDVVITGTLTPELSGTDVAEVIYERRQIPVILYSQHCDPDLVLNAEQKHVFMYLVKPICPEYLQAALKECYWDEADKLPEDDECNVPAGPPSGSCSDPPYREHVRPPYRKLPR